MIAITALDLAWEEINALGGSDPSVMSPDELAYNRAISDALEIIERLGGEDPAPKRAAAGRDFSDTDAIFEE
ncbi:hypothetical protein [Rhodopseudomonas sp. B29]|uniref:hypothetical protein n=1 Tax=Rhodopseudomonas sp. B29 TaxID=95607 RepID=UPI0003489C05|nr:hypothetical protein [Rhodopseudomonas sp. B29]